MDSAENYHLVFEHLMSILTKGSKFSHAHALNKLAEEAL
jgi:hypothetical protein